MTMQVACIQALTKVLMLSPLLSLEHEDLLSRCLQRCTLVQLAAVSSLSRLAQAHPAHHANALEMLGSLALDQGLLLGYSDD